MTSYEDQVVIVTGAGRGIGYEYARDFARRGAAVVVNDIAKAEADAVVAEIEAAGGNAIASYDSVATMESGAHIVDLAVERFDTVDVVVNNAGVVRPGLFADQTAQEISEVFDAHLLGPFAVTQPAWRIMQEKGYGRVMLVSSTSGLLAHGCMTGYSAAKAGVYGLMKAMAHEGLEHGINVNAVLPVAKTVVNTNDRFPQIAEYFGDIEATVGMDGRRSPTLVAHLVSYLCSRACTITGEAFSVVGGRYARVFVGVADGWIAPVADEVTAEAVGEHIDEIRDISAYSTPQWAPDELSDLGRRLRGEESFVPAESG